MDLQEAGRILLFVALVVALLGGLLWAMGRLGVGGRLGSLPGDVRIVRDGWSCFVPITTSIVLSLLLTLVLTLLARFLR